MLDASSLAWLAQESESFFLSHNAHREMETTVARHLLHRERLGETLIFATDTDRASCETGDEVWELSVRRKDGRLVHFVGANLKACLLGAQSQLMSRHIASLAA